MMYIVSISKTYVRRMKQVADKKSAEVGSIWADAISALLIGLQYKHEGEELIWLKKDGDEEYPFFALSDKDDQTEEVQISFSDEVNWIIMEVAQTELITPEMLLTTAMTTYLHGWNLREQFSLWVRTPHNASQLREVRIPSFA